MKMSITRAIMALGMAPCEPPMIDLGSLEGPECGSTYPTDGGVMEGVDDAFDAGASGDRDARAGEAPAALDPEDDRP